MIRMCSITHPEHTRRKAWDLFMWGEHWDSDRLEDIDPEELVAALRDTKRLSDDLYEWRTNPE